MAEYFFADLSACNECLDPRQSGSALTNWLARKIIYVGQRIRINKMDGEEVSLVYACLWEVSPSQNISQTLLHRPYNFVPPHFDSKHEEVEEVELEKLIPFRIMGLVFSATHALLLGTALYAADVYSPNWRRNESCML